MNGIAMRTPSKRRVCEEAPPSGWLTPSKVMQKFRNKKRALDIRLTVQSAPVIPEETCDAGVDVELPGAKNPFRVPRLEQGFPGQPSRKAHEFDCSLDADAEIWKLLSSPVKKKQRTDQVAVAKKQVDLPEAESGCTLLREDIPVDWSMKSRIRCIFTVKAELPPPLNPRRTFSAPEEASGVTAFVRRMDIKSSEFLLDSSVDARLREATCYWQHPNIPWMSLFPRNGTVLGERFLGDAVAKSGSVSTLVASDAIVQQGLRRDWEESLRSIYFMLKLKQCPYFYICASTFTCLFRAAGLDGREEIQAFVCPTTKGMRDALKREEIIFSMPLKRRSSQEADSEELRKEDDGTDSDEEMDSMLLSRIGLGPDRSSQTSSQGPGATGKHAVIDSSVVIDGKPESLVLIEAGDVQVFYGYFVESRWGWNTTGPHAGVPPSIFSPTAFLGASLGRLKVRRNEIEEKGRKKTQLDIVGPIMPNVVPSILDLFEDSGADFELNMACLPGTASFNSRPENETILKEEDMDAQVRFSVQNLSYCGLNEGLLTDMCRRGKTVSPNILSKVRCKGQFYEIS